MNETCLFCGMPAHYRIHLGVVKVEICEACLQEFKLKKVNKIYHPQLTQKERL